MYKPLGACAYCQNTWLGIAAWTMGHIYLGMRYRDWETDRKSTRLNSSHRL